MVARFLIRHGMAVLGYDKRGVGGSTGDWNTASFDDLAGDVVAAFEYLKTRRDIDAAQIGLLGISQAGWIMPLAAVRAKDIAFLISISGAGVPAAETTIDQARNEMTTTGMPPQAVDEIVGLLKLQYQFARTGKGWGALTHPSFAHEHEAPHNQRLEFLGDAVLGLCASDELCSRFPRADEGTLTRCVRSSSTRTHWRHGRGRWESRSSCDWDEARVLRVCARARTSWPTRSRR